MPGRHSIPHRLGFSLFEVIVAVTILAILTTIIAVRITGTTDRQVTLVVDKLGDMLVMYALRSEHSPVPIAITMDPARRMIGLVRREPGEFDDDESTWARDPVVPYINIPEFIEMEEIQVFADGDWVDVVEWPLIAMPGEDRPEVEIQLTHEQRTISLRLPPHGLTTVRQDSDVVDSKVIPRLQEDLDQSGRWQEDW
ncbi:MAG: type II secretion system GspH family protein [Phycisphaerales bacterium]|nr:type II secretion system GspH family protein [Phycisphaerales bacterium]